MRRGPATAISSDLAGSFSTRKARPGYGILGAGNRGSTHAGSGGRGWLTDNYSWRWVFYINIPIGVIALILTQLYIFDPPYLRKKAPGIDYWGIGLLVLGSAACGSCSTRAKKSWFSSHFIIVWRCLRVVGSGGLIVRELKASTPLST